MPIGQKSNLFTCQLRTKYSECPPKRRQSREGSLLMSPCRTHFEAHLHWIKPINNHKARWEYFIAFCRACSVSMFIISMRTYISLVRGTSRLYWGVKFSLLRKWQLQILPRLPKALGQWWRMDVSWERRQCLYRRCCEILWDSKSHPTSLRREIWLFFKPYPHAFISHYLELCYKMQS